jgi:hypothetical protein
MKTAWLETAGITLLCIAPLLGVGGTAMNGCHPQNVNTAPLIQASEKLGLCILQASVSDLVDAVTDPVSLIPAIIGSCGTYGTATAAQVLQVIEEFFAAAPASDGGVTPTTSALSLERLQKVHAAAAKVAGVSP